MQGRWNVALAAALALMAPGAVFAQGAAAGTKPEFKQESMNIFRRFPVEQREKMVHFYTKAVGLGTLNPIQLTSSQQMLLYRVGQTGQLKLAAGITQGREYRPGGAINDATGIRLFTFTFASPDEVNARFKAAGYPAPAWKDIGGGRKAAFVKDPGGFNVELLVDPANASKVGLEVGVNVTNLERSRAFYRDFAGLTELPAVKDPATGFTKYPFRHGETTISLWSVGKNLPKDTGSAGVQYVIGNIDAVNGEAMTRKIAVETPLGGVPGFNVRTVWLNDPDGATNYFYQMGAAPGGAGGARAPAGSPPAQ